MVTANPPNEDMIIDLKVLGGIILEDYQVYRKLSGFPIDAIS
jgi:hypothetical protein